ncbi:MAG: cupredoxin family protein, partial [Burkholderiales bacterium]|nr:cupredoxin family protein [Burkholderiales bacterium]
MKSIVIAHALLLGVISTSVYSHGDEKHAKAEKHGDKKNAGHAAAIGKPGDPAKVTRTIEVDMSDAMRFTPAKISVKRGETIKFVVKNSGKLKHEMVLGSVKELKKHAALMRKFPEMEHADPNQASVDPGQTGELVWQFTK